MVIIQDIKSTFGIQKKRTCVTFSFNSSSCGCGNQFLIQINRYVLKYPSKEEAVSDEIIRVQKAYLHVDKIQEYQNWLTG